MRRERVINEYGRIPWKKKSEPNLFYSNMDSLQKPTAKYKKSNNESNYQHTYLNLTHQ